MSKQIVTIVVPVKRRHIDEGEAGHGESCAIALALRDVCGQGVDVSAGDETLDIGNVKIPTPKFAAKFIYKFDDTSQGTPERRKLKPFTLHLKVPLCEVLGAKK